MAALDKIDRFLQGKNFETFTSDALTHDAVVRNLEVISEASRHLPEAMKVGSPQIPWRNVADMGNWLRHGYDVVSDRILWETISRDLPPLRTAVKKIITESKTE